MTKILDIAKKYKLFSKLPARVLALLMAAIIVFTLSPLTTLAEDLDEFYSENVEEPDNSDDSYTEEIPLKWIIRQHPDKSGLQGSFYTVQDENGEYLIVVDGGHGGKNADYVRKVIKQLGGHVNLWIITHYHADHVDAFNEIFAKPKGIKIDNVYDTPLPKKVFKEVAKSWDDKESFYNYKKLTAGNEKVHHVIRGEECFVGDLKITFLNTYDDYVLDYGKGDIPNNCSLVFTIESTNKKMLFMSDCHSKKMGKLLMRLYSEELKSDFLQPAHHGNNSIPTDIGFYQAVDAKRVYFDAPDWLMNSKSYTCRNLSKYLKKNFENINIYNFKKTARKIKMY